MTSSEHGCDAERLFREALPRFFVRCGRLRFGIGVWGQMIIKYNCKNIPPDLSPRVGFRNGRCMTVRTYGVLQGESGGAGAELRDTNLKAES